MIQIYATFNQYIFTLKTTQTESEVIKIDILWNWQSETIPGDNTELCFQQSLRHIPFKIFIEYYPRYVHARQQINLNKFKKTEDMLNVFTLEWKGFAFRLNFSCGRKDICKVFEISINWDKTKWPHGARWINFIFRYIRWIIHAIFKIQMTQINKVAHACNPNTWKAEAGKFLLVQCWHGNLMISIWAVVQTFVSKSNQRKLKLQSDPKTVTYSGLMLQNHPNWIYGFGKHQVAHKAKKFGSDH